METILYNISQVIGVAIIHSLWQALFIYLSLRLILLCAVSVSSKAKHNIAMLSLVTITGWFIYTLLGEIKVHQWVEIENLDKTTLPAILGIPLHVPHGTTYSSRYNYTIEGILPYITIIYLGGLIFNTTRLVWARKRLNGIRKNVSVDIQMLHRVKEFAEMLDIGKKVSVGLSTLIDVPCMIGFFKPIILLPATIATSLSAEEIEAILLHELAHIKRNDYLINLAQQAMSVLLFFNPFAQLINRIINHERENSCDDIVIESTHKPIVYAHALLKLEQSRGKQWQLALAATGKKYHLLNRIERIMKTQKPIGNARHILLAIALLTASITGLAWLNPTIANGKISLNKIKPVIITTHLLDDTVRKKTTKPPHQAATKKTAKATHDTYFTSEDVQLEKLSQEVGKYGEAIGKYFESPEFKKYSEELTQKGNEIEAYYNRPEVKQMQIDQEKLAANFQKNWAETPETKEWGTRMGELGQDIEKYYNSPEFKAYNEQLEKKYGIAHNQRYHDDAKDENYRKYQAELEQHVPADIKQKTEELKNLGEKMRGHYDSPEFRQQTEKMKIMGDSIRKVFNNPALKIDQEQMRKLSQQMHAMQNDPQIKKLQAQMRVAEAKLHEYMNSPDFKKRMELIKKNAMNFNMNMNMDKNMNLKMDSDKPERPEAPEKPDSTDNK